jgi:hypothetical protein
MAARFLCLFIGPIGVLGVLAGCDARVSSPTCVAGEPDVFHPRCRRRQRETAAGGFFNRIRQADPDHRTIDRAMLNERNELGLILDRTVEMDRVPDLMRSILAQMAREFPGQDLSVLAYTPSNPLHKIGTAQFDTQTRDMTYTPTQ